MICFKFQADKKPASVMSLQSEGYPKTFSNLDDQLLIKLTKETKLLEKNAPIYRYHAPLRILFRLNNLDPFRGKRMIFI